MPQIWGQRSVKMGQNRGHKGMNRVYGVTPPCFALSKVGVAHPEVKE